MISFLSNGNGKIGSANCGAPKLGSGASFWAILKTLYLRTATSEESFKRVALVHEAQLKATVPAARYHCSFFISKRFGKVP